jgi:hypothetical protein
MEASERKYKYDAVKAMLPNDKTQIYMNIYLSCKFSRPCPMFEGKAPLGLADSFAY